MAPGPSILKMWRRHPLDGHFTGLAVGDMTSGQGFVLRLAGAFCPGLRPSPSFFANSDRLAE